MPNRRDEMERRSYEFEIRSERRDDGGFRLYGNPIVYSSPTDIGGYFREIIEPGALDNADMTDVPLLVNHNDRMIPVARSRRNTPNSTLQLRVVPTGLEMEASLDTENNMTSRELGSAVERGDITGMSFRFEIADERWEGLETDYPTRHILGFARIGEVSAVTWPAYEATDIYTRSKAALESARSALESARQQSAPLESGDTLELLKAKIEVLTEDIKNA